MVSKLVLSIGSNCNSSFVESAVDWLKDQLADFESSPFYETPSAKGDGKPYVNAVVSGNTTSDFEKFNSLLKEYEKASGRDSSCRESGLVPIDIDIVIWNDQILRPWDYRQTFFKIGYMAIKPQFS